MRISFILKNKSDKGGEIPFGEAWQWNLHIEDEEQISPVLKGLRKRVRLDQLELANLYIDKARVVDIDPDKLKYGFSKSLRYDALLSPKRIVNKHEEPIRGSDS